MLYIAIGLVIHAVIRSAHGWYYEFRESKYAKLSRTLRSGYFEWEGVTYEVKTVENSK